MKRVLIAMLCLGLMGCASSRGFDRGRLRSEVRGEQKVVSEKDIQKALDLKPQLPAPFKLAVYLGPEKSMCRWEKGLRWTAEDKDTMLQVGAGLKEKKIISEMVVLNEALVEGEGNRAIRLAAARAGADAVIIINAVSDIDHFNNYCGPFYALLVTILIVPGTELDALVMMNASMWDVRNQYLYLSVDAEAMAKQVRPEAWIREQEAVKSAKAEAFGAVRKELGDRIVALASRKD